MGVYKEVAGRLAGSGTADAETGGFDAADVMFRGILVPWMLEKTLIDSAAADVTDAYEVGTDEQGQSHYVPYATTITNAIITPYAALTAHATDYATITLAYDAGAGGAQTTIATFASDTVTTDDWVAKVNKAMTLATLGGVAVPAGSNLVFSIAKAGSGVVVPRFRLFAYGKLT